jgi:predicted transcriptional regulator
VRQIGINPARVIIELTESQPTCDYAQMREAVLRYRQMGFQIAIDDLGEGFSSLRLWSELRPEYVKIDMHFIQGINHDPVKLQFVRSIQEIAEKSNTLVIAEGIETRPELLALRDIGVACGQGYHLGRPQPAPLRTAPGEVVQALARRHDQHAVSIHKLLREVPAVPSSMSNDEVYEIFQRDPKLMSIPVADHGQPQGLINRCNMIERFARPGERELYGRKACAHFMDRTPLVADRNTSLRELSHPMAKAEAHHLLNGFIITEQGRYLGMGTGHDLMREISEMHIHAANMAAPSARITSA